MVLVGLAAGVLGACAPMQTESAKNTFDALSFEAPYRVVNESDLRSGGRQYAVAVKGSLSESSVSAPGFSHVTTPAQGLVVRLRGADPSPGRSGECSVGVYEGADVPAGTAASDERLYHVTVECATREG